MTLRSIVLVDDRASVTVTTAAGTRPAAPGEYLGIGEFAESLARHTAGEVVVRDDVPLGAVHEATAILCGRATLRAILAYPDRVIRDRLTPRVVLLDAERSGVLALLEAHRLAGAVDQHRLFRWRFHRDAEQGAGLYGLQDVARRMDATCSTSGPSRSARYCVLASPRFDDLPSLLVAYLNCYFDAA